MAAARPKYNAGSIQPQSMVVNALQFATLQAFIDHAANIKLVMPCKAKIIGVRLNVGRKGGTFVTGTLDVLAAGVSILGAAFDVAAIVANTPVDKEVADLAAGAAAVAANTELTVAVVEDGGTNPTWADVMLQIDYVPLGG